MHLRSTAPRTAPCTDARRPSPSPALRHQEDSDDSEAPAGDKDKEEDDAAWAKAVTAGKLSKGDKLSAVDHSTIEYPPFRRNFYIEVRVRAAGGARASTGRGSRCKLLGVRAAGGARAQRGPRLLLAADVLIDWG